MNEEKNPLDLETRKKIYRLVSKSPGLHFRELQRRTGLVVGELQYHLDFLKKGGLVVEEKDRDYSRYFVKDDFSEEEAKVMSFLRQSAIRKILFFLLKNPNSNQGDISKAAGLSPSTVSWHLKRLTDSEILKNKHKGRHSYFSVSKPDIIIKLLISYKDSFLDNIVDKFIDSWAGT